MVIEQTTHEIKMEDLKSGKIGIGSLFDIVEPEKKFAHFCPCCGYLVETDFPVVSKEGEKKLVPICNVCSIYLRKYELSGKTASDVLEMFRSECEKRDIIFEEDTYSFGAALRKLSYWEREDEQKG